MHVSFDAVQAEVYIHDYPDEGVRKSKAAYMSARLRASLSVAIDLDYCNDCDDQSVHYIWVGQSIHPKDEHGENGIDASIA